MHLTLSICEFYTHEFKQGLKVFRDKITSGRECIFPFTSLTMQYSNYLDSFYFALSIVNNLGMI